VPKESLFSFFQRLGMVWRRPVVSKGISKLAQAGLQTPWEAMINVDHEWYLESSSLGKSVLYLYQKLNKSTSSIYASSTPFPATRPLIPSISIEPRLAPTPNESLPAPTQRKFHMPLKANDCRSIKSEKY
jgi:hypothetical protein